MRLSVVENFSIKFRKVASFNSLSTDKNGWEFISKMRDHNGSPKKIHIFRNLFSNLITQNIKNETLLNYCFSILGEFLGCLIPPDTGQLKKISEAALNQLLFWYVSKKELLDAIKKLALYGHRDFRKFLRGPYSTGELKYVQFRQFFEDF